MQGSTAPAPWLGLTLMGPKIITPTLDAFRETMEQALTVYKERFPRRSIYRIVADQLVSLKQDEVRALTGVRPVAAAAPRVPRIQVDPALGLCLGVDLAPDAEHGVDLLHYGHCAALDAGVHAILVYTAARAEWIMQVADTATPRALAFYHAAAGPPVASVEERYLTPGSTVTLRDGDRVIMGDVLVAFHITSAAPS